MNRQLLFDAVEFAARAHRGQVRKTTAAPYLVHPLRVAEILLEHGCSDTLAIAAVLHDTVEDTPATLDEIRENFGAEVAALVAHASEPDKSDTWENRKQQTIDSLASDPLDALLLECADKLDNIRSIRKGLNRLGAALWSSFHRPREQQRWYYTALATAFVARSEGEPGESLVREFEREVHEVFS